MTSPAPKPDNAMSQRSASSPSSPDPTESGELGVLSGLLIFLALVTEVISWVFGFSFPFLWLGVPAALLILVDKKLQERNRTENSTPGPSQTSRASSEPPRAQPETQRPAAGPPPLVPVADLVEEGSVRYYVSKAATLSPTSEPVHPHFPLDWDDKTRHATIKCHRFTDEERMRRAGILIGSWQEAEHTAMLWMREHGYSDAELTPAGPDGGVDVVSRSAIAQVKHYARPVSPGPIRELAGVMAMPQHRGTHGLFFSTMGYSVPARNAARRLDITLLEMGAGGQWVRVP